MIHQRYGQTDGQTDVMQSQDRALHCSASRGKNKADITLFSDNIPNANPTAYLTRRL